MKIGLLGYGKMGKAIEQVAEQKGLEIAWRAGRDVFATLEADEFKQADVVIEFTRPEAAFANVMRCLEAGIPVVSGTTGWLDQLSAAQQFCRDKGGAMLWASNFSVGVNLFFALNQQLAQLMSNQPEYAASLVESHHIHKLDAPSGTALTLIQDILANVPRYNDWSLGTGPEGVLPVEAIRTGEVPGTHLIRWQSEADEISIEHKAHSRQGFAAGAVVAARWLAGKQGVFTMRDVLGL